MATDTSAHLGEAMLQLATVLSRHGVPYALIGGLATGYHARPRYTEDIDLLLDVSPDALPALLLDLAHCGFIFDDASVRTEWAQDHLAVFEFGGIRIDWIGTAVACYRRIVDRAQPADWHGTSVPIAAAEGVMLTKLIAFRGQDRLDILELLFANRGQLDVDYIRRELETVFDAGDPKMLAFDEMLKTAYLPPPAGPPPLPAHRTPIADSTGPHDGSSP